MKSYLLTIALLLFSAVAFCQVVEFKKDIVWIDGKECITMSKEDAVSISFKDMNGTDLMLLRFIHNSRYGSLYCKVTFVAEKLSFTSQSYIYTKKILIQKLAQNKVIQNCAFDLEKLQRFILKFDENIERY